MSRQDAKHSIRVECQGAKPNARSVAAAVWGISGVADHDGENWEQLRLTSSKDESQWVEVKSVSDDPLVLEVSSLDRGLAHSAAFFLAMETHGRFL